MYHSISPVFLFPICSFESNIEQLNLGVGSNREYKRLIIYFSTCSYNCLIICFLVAILIWSWRFFFQLLSCDVVWGTERDRTIIFRFRTHSAVISSNLYKIKLFVKFNMISYLLFRFLMFPSEIRNISKSATITKINNYIICVSLLAIIRDKLLVAELILFDITIQFELHETLHYGRLMSD